MKYHRCLALVLAFWLLSSFSILSRADETEATSHLLVGSECSVNTGSTAIRDARSEFNLAIADRDIDSIQALLSNDVVLITGTDSDVFIGREEQLNLWISDFTNDSRLIYLRSPNCIKLSNLHPIAMEYARWRGARPASDKNFVGGDYVAKWRLIDDHWTIDAETYMTNECGGSLCGGEK